MTEYEIYQKMMTKDEYFGRWTPEDLNNLRKAGEEKVNAVYRKYKVKCKIFQRDGFACQNEMCETPESPLTWHHIKKRSNGGKDRARNGVTLCDRCHKKFHRGKMPIVLPDADHLPTHVRGHTFWEHVEDEIDWKEVKAQMKKLRKRLKHSNEIRYIKWDEIAELLNWLYRNRQ